MNSSAGAVSPRATPGGDLFRSVPEITGSIAPNRDSHQGMVDHELDGRSYRHPQGARPRSSEWAVVSAGAAACARGARNRETTGTAVIIRHYVTPDCGSRTASKWSHGAEDSNSMWRWQQIRRSWVWVTELCIRVLGLALGCSWSINRPRGIRAEGEVALRWARRLSGSGGTRAGS